MEALEVDDLISLKKLKYNKEWHLQSRINSSNVFMLTLYATQTDAHAMIQNRLWPSKHTAH